ncbi:MAG: M28 family peptidase [Treponema sp.]|nr:M28 family peptidase [Treponema sp.]
MVLPLWGFASDEGSPGAGDNMAASAIALEIFKEFAERRAAGAGLKRTRLAFASFDAEEAGLRGARVFARRCKGEPCGHALGQRCSGQCLPHPGGHAGGGGSGGRGSFAQPRSALCRGYRRENPVNPDFKACYLVLFFSFPPRPAFTRLPSPSSAIMGVR